MYRYLLAIATGLLSLTGFSQKIITSKEAVDLSLQNKINSRPAQLELQQQQLLSGSSGILDNPEAGIEKSPYEGTIASITQRLRFPAVYTNRKGLQRERIQLSQLLLQMNQFEVSRLVRTNYLEMQFLTERRDLITYQDSLYQFIKIAAQRNFEAGQINKLEELFAQNLADKVHNERERIVIDLRAQQIAFGYLTNFSDTFLVEKLAWLPPDSLLNIFSDTLMNNVRKQVLQQQVSISQKQLRLQKSLLYPELTASALLPLNNNAISPFGYRFGISIPVWLRQNRAQIKAARTGVQLAEAQRDREMIKLSREYRLALSNLLKEQQSLDYYNRIALQQAKEIEETSLRLFNAGQINYTETLRNIINAFDTRNAYLESLRNFNQSIIELNYLTGNK